MIDSGAGLQIYYRMHIANRNSDLVRDKTVMAESNFRSLVRRYLSVTNKRCKLRYD
ncbi:hypothetical protein JHFBIEKO_3125 [Methylobacterium mesophilicum]|nr:hypothetical protein JHFBIEKO_3125 [Methylobacterium mesophilicum]